jgi:hypothetical protein
MIQLNGVGRIHGPAGHGTGWHGMDRHYGTGGFFILKEDLMALRGSMRDSATQYLRPAQPIRAAIGGQAANAMWPGWAGR